VYAIVIWKHATQVVGRALSLLQGPPTAVRFVVSSTLVLGTDLRCTKGGRLQFATKNHCTLPYTVEIAGVKHLKLNSTTNVSHRTPAMSMSIDLLILSSSTRSCGKIFHSFDELALWLWF
jgi:hypothetical protein